jgi:ABC-type antimicrobial peptide transport system permease subunit
MKKAFAKSLVLAILVGLAVHYLTPAAATLVYELYHLVKVEMIYTVYGALRFLSAHFMLWDQRWIVSVAVGIAVGIVGAAIVLWRSYRTRTSV